MPSPLTGQPQVDGERVGPAVAITAVLLAVEWGQELADQFLFGGSLDCYGIVPRQLDTLGHIFSAPFLHGDFTHLMSNTLALGVLAFLSALRGVGRFVLSTLVIVGVGGLLVWLLARGGLHLGGSELVFGYLGLLLGWAWHERQAASGSAGGVGADAVRRRAVGRVAQRPAHVV